MPWKRCIVARRAAFLAAGWVVIAGWAGKCPAQTTAPAPAGSQPATQPAPRPVPGLFEPAAKAEPYAETSRLLWQMLAYVLLILAIGAVGIFLARRVLPRMRAVGGKRIQLVETVYLGPRQTLHLVRVGRKSLLVAGTRERISMLADVTGAFEEAPGRDVSDSPH